MDRDAIERVHRVMDETAIDRLEWGLANVLALLNRWAEAEDNRPLSDRVELIAAKALSFELAEYVRLSRDSLKPL